MFNAIAARFSSLFSRLSGKGTLSAKQVDEALAKVHETLIDADVSLEVADRFLEEIKNRLVGASQAKNLVPSEQVIRVVHDSLTSFLGGNDSNGDFSFAIPSVIMVLGLQGSGKTTSLAKIAHHIKESATARGKSRRILMASADVYRPAAIDQLEILAKSVGVDFYRAQASGAVEIAIEIHDRFKQGAYEYLLLDTAGRLHIDQTMLEELIQTDRITKPKYKFLVLDAMTGQEAITVARAFNVVSYTGAILSKTDGDSRCGVAFSFRYECKKPVLFMGTGERIEDLEFFRPERMADRIIGMGDMATLLEQADKKINQADQDTAQRAFERGRLTFSDFLGQLEMVNNLGSLSSLMRLVPGASGLNLSSDQMAEGEREMKTFRAIIQSMTPKERTTARLTEPRRKQRIAQGAGVSLSILEAFLKKFEQSQQFVKIFKKVGLFKNPHL